MRARTLLLFGFLSAVACRPSTRPADSAAASDSAVLARTWGLAYLQSNQLPQAETEFRKVIALAPEQSLGYADLGLVYLRAGRYGEAAAQLDRAAQLDSANSDVGLMRAEVYEQTGRAGEARQEIERVLRRDSTDLRALYALAQLPGQDHEALVRKIVARAPANLVARLELVDLLLGRGAAGDAAGELEALQRQLPQLPREGARFFERALRAARAGRAPEAATQAKLFHHAMEVTAAYQVSLQRLGGATGALVGYPILTFNQSMAVPTQDARAVAAAIRFTDVTAGSGLAVVAALPDSVARSLERGVALAAGDYDDDEIEDLYVAGHPFRGDRGAFVETTGRAGVALRVRPTAAAFGDFDNDGRLDLFVATAGGEGGRAALFRGTGDGRFQNVAAASRLVDSTPAARVLFTDLDHDGDLDLLVAAPTGNRVYRNNMDGTFTETTAATGLAGAARAGAVAVGDYDNDGFLDLFVTSLDGTDPALYHNRGDGTFELDRRSAGLRQKLRGVAGLDAAFFDFDNDGWLDLIVVGKPGTPNGRGVFLFRNDVQRGFEDMSSILPDSLRAGRAVTVADFDQDGDLDLVVVGWDGRPRLLRNDGGNVNQYVQVRLAALRQGSGKSNEIGRAHV